ncbi:Sperm-associated antigen 1 [Plecturocebus cupreus]
MKSPYDAQTVLKLLGLSPSSCLSPPNCWDYRCKPSYMATHGVSLLLPRLEYKGMILAHCNPCLLGSNITLVHYIDDIMLIGSSKQAVANTLDLLVNEELQQPNPGRTTDGPDPSGMKVRVIPPGKKKPGPAEVLAEGKGNTEWVVEEGGLQGDGYEMPVFTPQALRRVNSCRRGWLLSGAREPRPQEAAGAGGRGLADGSQKSGSAGSARRGGARPGFPRARPLRPVPPRPPKQLLPVMQTLTSRIRFPTEPAEPAGAAHTAQPCAMGNIQKKLTSKAEGGKRPARGAPRRGQTPEASTDKRSRQRASAVAGGSANRHPSGGRGEGDPVAPPPAAPVSPADLKSQGNELFRSGQFAEAAHKYSAAIALMEPAGSESADDLSILYSNRAACYLKEGNCGGCIQDCNRALELHPFSMKPLLRRAMAYETLEQYGKAYVDYKTVLQIDCRLQLANDSVNRLSRILMELDGPNWREKLSPIPAVPASVPLQAWHPATEMISNQAENSSSHHQQAITDEKTFKALKEEGNQCANDKNYEGALSKYSECLKINNKESLCYLKLCQFEAAKQDCDQALQLDDGNVKACYRRALAHKGLKNYQKSLIDLNKVLLLDPSIIEAKMELEEVTRLLNLKDKTASFNKGKERRKIEIQEVNEGNEEEPGRLAGEVSTGCLASEKGDKSTGSPEDPEKLLIAKPNNAYEFGQIINTLSTRKDKEACAHLLAITAPEDLPMLLSNKLEGDTFLLLIQSLKNYLIEKDPSLVYQHLLYLSKAERFKMMLTLISKGQKELIEQLFEDLSGTPNNHFTLEDIQALQRQYEL